jgi:ABC-type branched-subunit amino acid transport system permease subunit
MAKKTISLIQGIIFNRRVQILILVVLLFIPTLFWAQEWCQDASAFANPLQASGCTYLIETKPVTSALLLSFTQMFILITLASNWNLTGGFTGYIDFGHAVFFGLGSFSTALLMGASRWSEWPAI